MEVRGHSDADGLYEAADCDAMRHNGWVHHCCTCTGTQLYVRQAETYGGEPALLTYALHFMSPHLIPDYDGPTGWELSVTNLDKNESIGMGRTLDFAPTDETTEPPKFGWQSVYLKQR